MKNQTIHNILLSFFIILFFGFKTVYSQDLIDVNKTWYNSNGTIGTASPPPYWMYTIVCVFDTNGVF